MGCSILSSLIAAIFQGYENVVPNAIFVNIVNPGLVIVFLVAALRTAPTSDVFPASLAAYVAAAIATLLALSVYARIQLPRRLPPGPVRPGRREG